jgi:hypothetical protein
MDAGFTWLRSRLHPPPGSGSFAFMILRPENCFTNQEDNKTVISFSLYPPPNARADCCQPR